MRTAKILALSAILNFKVHSTNIHELELKPLVDSKSTSSTKATHEESAEDRPQLSTEEKLMPNSIQEGIKPDQSSELPIGRRAYNSISSGPLSGGMRDGLLEIKLEALELPDRLQMLITRFKDNPFYDEAVEGIFKLIVMCLRRATGAPEVMVFTRQEWPSYSILDAASEAPGLGYITLDFDPFAIRLSIGKKVYSKEASDQD